MFKKQIIKSVLLEGSVQISAALPKLNLVNPENKFTFFFPVVLNSSIIIDETTFDSFKVVLYNKNSFSSEFKSKIIKDSPEAEVTNNFKNFNVVGLEDSLPQFQKNISNNFYFDKNVVTTSYDINFDIDLVETFFDQKIYKIGFTNAQSKEMKAKNFECFRIFCIKDNNVVYDTDVVLFPNVNFLKDVFENRKVLDFSFFVNTFYLKDFQDNLNLSAVRRSLLDPEIVIKIVTSNQIDFNIATGDIVFSLEYKGSSGNKILRKEMSLSNLSGFASMRNNNRFFEKITEDFAIDKKLFQFDLSCKINFANNNINKIYIKTLVFRRNDSFIRNIVDFSTRSFNQNAFDSLKLSVKQNLLEDSGNLFLVANNSLISRDILKSFFISNVFQNETSIIDNLHISDAIDINSFISLSKKTLFDIFDATNSVRLHFRNNQTKIKSKIKVEIRSVLSTEFVKHIESDSILNRPNLTNAFSDINKLFKRNIVVSNKDVELISLGDDDSINQYNTIQIVNLEIFNNIALSFGYKMPESDVRGDIKDFLASCVFSIDVHEKIGGINDTDFRFKNYFFGEEILDMSSLDENSNNIFFLQSFLKKINFNIGQLTRSLSNSNKDLANIKSILNHSIAERKDNILLVKNFIENTNISVVKNLKITIIPIQKQIKEHKNIGIDALGTIDFPVATTDDVKASVNQQFVNMFYDTNSSLNWGIFNKFKNTYFFKPGSSSTTQVLVPNSSINDTTISFAKTIYPIWDYLSSNLYVLNSEIFNSTSEVDKNNFLESVPGIENNFDNFSKVIKNYHFQDFGTEHFNFSDKDNLISVSDIGLSYRVSDFLNNNINEPRKINFVKNSALNSLNFSFDITSLKIRHTIDDIVDSEMFLKYSIHPLIFQESDIDFKNSGFYPSSIGDENSYITQNNYYMSTANKNYFKDYNIAINKSSMQINHSSKKLMLKIHIDNENNLIDSSTFRDLFDFCIQNNSIVLKDFIVRFTISMKINNFYYSFNLHKEIPRINFQNTVIRINNIRNIKI